MPSVESPTLSKAPPLWLFSIMEMPYGMMSGLIRLVLPYLLRQAGFNLAKTGAMVALISLPGTFCILYAPIVDFWLKRQTWLIASALLSAIFSGFGIWFLGAAPINAITIFFLSASSLAILVSAATGGLMSTLLTARERSRVGGWVQAGNLSAASLGGGLLLILASDHGNHFLAVIAFAVIVLPALAALAVPEVPIARSSESYASRLGTVAQGLKDTLISKSNAPGLLLLAAPIGTGAMATLMSGMTHEYGASVSQLAFARGFAGGALTAAGAMCVLLMPTRISPLVPYALTGLLYGTVCLAVASSPLRPSTLIFGLLLSNFARGMSFGCYTGVVLQIMGNGGHGQSSRYVLLNSVGTLPIMYMTWIGGFIVERFGTRSLGAFDGSASILAALAFGVWWILRRSTSISQAITS